MDVLWSISGAIGNDREGEIGMRRLVDERKGSSEAEDFQEGEGIGERGRASRLFPPLAPCPVIYIYNRAPFTLQRRLRMDGNDEVDCKGMEESERVRSRAESFFSWDLFSCP